MKIKLAAMHSDLEQVSEGGDAAFKNNKVVILVATDIVARVVSDIGIWIGHQYDVPRDPRNIIHRISAYGRAAATVAQ